MSSSFRRKPESILISNSTMDPGFRRDDGKVNDVCGFTIHTPENRK